MLASPVSLRILMVWVLPLPLIGGGGDLEACP